MDVRFEVNYTIDKVQNTDPHIFLFHSMVYLYLFGGSGIN